MRWALVALVLGGCARVFGIDTQTIAPDTTIVDAPPAPGTWLAVAGGLLHTCAIAGDQRLWCWGRNDFGELGRPDAVELDVPAQVGTASWLEVSAYNQHTCGIQIDHTLWCWGDDTQGLLGIPIVGDNMVRTPTKLPGAWKHVATGYLQTCAIAMDDTPWCAGFNNKGQLLGNPASMTLVQLDTGAWSAIATSDETVCGIKSSGELWCWGANDFGEVGVVGVAVQSAMQHVDAADEPFTAIAMSVVTSCAIDGAHVLRCWGDNRFGQLGDQTVDGRSTPMPVDSDRDTWSSIAVGGFTACGITTAGDTRCWGDNRRGQLANPVFDGFAFRTQPGGVPGAWRAIALGRNHLCAIDATTRMLSCAGGGGDGALGDGSGSHVEPAVVAPGDAVAVGYASSCAIASGALSCWGYNAFGAVGDATQIDRARPVGLPGSWLSVSVGAHACAIDATNGLACWGANDHGEIDGARPTAVLTPAPITAVAMPWIAVAASLHHTCAITTLANLYCWGANDRGQSAAPGTADATITNVAGSWDAIATGDLGSCGVASSGDIECWGDGASGELGDGTTTAMRATPTLVFGPLGASSVSAGTSFACAADPGLACWGLDDRGQLGNQTTTSGAMPEPIPGPWLQVSAGSQHACAIRGDQTLWCWGDNRWGQLGDGTLFDRHSPGQVGSDTWLAVSAGAHHTCGVRSDHEILCWGANVSGEVGDGTAWRSALTPTR